MRTLLETYKLILLKEAILISPNGTKINVEDVPSEDIKYANEKLEEYRQNNTFDGFPLFIAVTGKKQRYYTLWKETHERVFYLKNLSFNFKDAIDEAINIAKQEKADSVEIQSEVGNRKKIAVDEIDFGKYMGKKLGEVFLENKGYIVWLVNNFNPKTKRDKEFIAAAKDILSDYVKEKTEKNIATDNKDYYSDNVSVDTVIKITNVNLYNPSAEDAIWKVASVSIRGENDKNRFSFYVDPEKIAKIMNIENLKELKNALPKLIGKEIEIKGNVKDRKVITGLKYTVLTRVTKLVVLGGNIDFDKKESPQAQVSKDELKSSFFIIVEKLILKYIYDFISNNNSFKDLKNVSGLVATDAINYIKDELIKKSIVLDALKNDLEEMVNFYKEQSNNLADSTKIFNIFTGKIEMFDKFKLDTLITLINVLIEMLKNEKLKELVDSLNYQNVQDMDNFLKINYGDNYDLQKILNDLSEYNYDSKI